MLSSILSERNCKYFFSGLIYPKTKNLAASGTVATSSFDEVAVTDRGEKQDVKISPDNV